MECVLTADEMRQVEKDSMLADGRTEEELIECAAQELEKYLLDWKKKNSMDCPRIGIFAGPGNNGADAITLFRKLLENDLRFAPELFLLEKELGQRFSEGHLCQWKKLEKLLSLRPEAQKKVRHIYTDHTYTDHEIDAMISGMDLIVDGIFGIGLTRPLSGLYYQVIERIKHMHGEVLAIDLPSGIHSESGQVMGTVLPANTTLTFGQRKRGHVLDPGRSDYCGRVMVSQMGFIHQSTGSSYLIEAKDAKHKLPVRGRHSHKGTFGNVLIAGGTKGMAGAVITAAMAAYRSGCGLVSLLSGEDNRVILQIAVPEAVFLDEAQIETFPKRISSVVIGPGMGMSPWAKEKMARCLTGVLDLAKGGRILPLVIDADGLNMLAESEELADLLKELNGLLVPVLLTPHVLEAARLLKVPVDKLAADLPKAALQLATKYHAVCIVKDSATVIAGRDGRVYINSTGCSGMAKGGSGDVLAGLLGSLLAQKVDAMDAAILGVYLHGLAGQLASEKLGEAAVMARDLADGIGDAIRWLNTEIIE